jgi:hypothetical protein
VSRRPRVAINVSRPAVSPPWRSDSYASRRRLHVPEHGTTLHNKGASVLNRPDHGRAKPPRTACHESLRRPHRNGAAKQGHFRAFCGSSVLVTSKYNLQAQCYRAIRERFGLSANLALRAIARVAVWDLAGDIPAGPGTYLNRSRPFRLDRCHSHPACIGRSGFAWAIRSSDSLCTV